MTLDFTGAAGIVFIFGACIGSFLNVCIYRIPQKKSIVFPGSFCPNCKNEIPFYYNIPVLSYIYLKGRCKFCKVPISIRYPMIEALTGFFAVAVYMRFGLGLTSLYWFLFISVLITISFVDIDHQIIPDVISLPGIIIFASSFYFIPEMTWKQTLIGILAGGGSLLGVSYIYTLVRKQEGMGGGDIKLLAMIGAAVGLKGIFFTIFSASLLGTMAGVLMMLYNRTSDIQFKIPFGPFLSAGAVLYIFFGQQVIVWYFSLLEI